MSVSLSITKSKESLDVSTFKVIEVYPNIIAQASAVNYGVEVNKNIDNMDISYDEKKMLKDEWSTYFQLFLEGHDDEIRVTFDNQIFITENDIDFSKKHIVVFNESNPKWKDRREYISLWNKSTRQSSIDLGEALAIVPTGHYSGSSYTFQAAFWYNSWESFLVNQKSLENSGPMNDDQKNLFGIDKLNIKRSIIPAVTHVDYTARVQTVHKETNKKYLHNFIFFNSNII